MQHEQALAALKTASSNHRSLTLGDPRILQVAQMVTEDPGCSPAKCLDAGVDPHAILGALGHNVVAFTGEGNLTPLALSAVLLEEARLRRATAPADAAEQAFTPGAEPAVPETGDPGHHAGIQHLDHYGPVDEKRMEQARLLREQAEHLRAIAGDPLREQRAERLTSRADHLEAEARYFGHQRSREEGGGNPARMVTDPELTPMCVAIAGGDDNATRQRTFSLLEAARVGADGRPMQVLEATDRKNTPAAKWANIVDAEYEAFPAAWDDDRRAGIRRNEQLLEEQPDLVIVLADETDRGASHLAALAHDYAIPLVGGDGEAADETDVRAAAELVTEQLDAEDERRERQQAEPQEQAPDYRPRSAAESAQALRVRQRADEERPAGRQHDRELTEGWTLARTTAPPPAGYDPRREPREIRVLVTGSRNYPLRQTLEAALDRVRVRVAGAPLRVVHGGAAGADRMAAEWADQHGVPADEYPASWDRHGAKAGRIRNREMLDNAKPDLVLAFPWGQSSGTAHMMRIAERKGVPIEAPQSTSATMSRDGTLTDLARLSRTPTPAEREQAAEAEQKAVAVAAAARREFRGGAPQRSAPRRGNGPPINRGHTSPTRSGDQPAADALPSSPQP